MADAVTLTLPIPPSANKLWVWRDGGYRKAAAYGQWRRSAVAQINALMLGKERFGKALVTLDIVCQRPNKRRDLDNCIKPLQDALQAATVFDDDRQVMALAARWEGEGSDLTVTIRAIDAGQPNLLEAA